MATLISLWNILTAVGGNKACGVEGFEITNIVSYATRVRLCVLCWETKWAALLYSI